VCVCVCVCFSVSLTDSLSLAAEFVGLHEALVKQGLTVLDLAR
jgi:hypothetical protein